MTVTAQISELFDIQTRFLRSAHLERDFSDSKALSGYVLTPQAQSYAERLATGLATTSGQRAWRITGDFGTGKSSFALLIAHLFSGRSEGLPSHLRQAVDFNSVGVSRPRFLPVLVTGSRESLALALLRSLHRDVLNTCNRGRIPAVINKIQKEIVRSGDTGVSDEAVISLISEANAHVTSSGKGTGLLIILDELGKFLEYSALHPDRQDVYLLQNLAESASRSGKTPLFVVGLLHQGFNAYADHLSQSAQKEWEKVAGRFEELIFNQPLEQTALLVADALNIKAGRMSKGISIQVRRDMVATLDLAWYGAAVARRNLTEAAERLYPLHPTVMPVLVKLFSRFGQNERSLFSFLLSSEPFGLQDFAQQAPRADRFYRLHNLYDYAKSAFGHRLGSQSYRSHWNLIDSMIESFPVESDLDLRVLKTVGLLNLLDSNNLLASDEIIGLAVAGRDTAEATNVKDAIKKLHKVKRVLYHRGASGGYCLWPHTSVNLEKAYANASRSLGPAPQRVSSLISSYLETRPLVARRHYIETGNLRHFEVRFTPVAELSESLKFSHDVTDGVVVVALCETEEERREALNFAVSGAMDRRPEVLLAVPNPLNILAKLVQEVQRWELVEANTPELSNDNFAAEEVSRQIALARRMLEERIHSFIGLQQLTGRTELVWFRQSQSLEIGNGRDLLSYLSVVCDEAYDKAPKIQNELVNRRSLSSAASAARMRLMQGIFTSSSKSYLGMDPTKKPPEMSIYLSVLQRSGLHREIAKGYALTEPDRGQDPCRIRPALRKIRQILEARADSRVNVAEILSELRRPPYGIREGISPMLLAVFAVMNEQYVAFYDNGAFMREMAGLDVMRFAKVPEAFEIQYCNIGGLRSELFDQLFQVLKLRSPDDDKIDVLDVVRPLCVFAAQLQPYAHKTMKLSPAALAVRTVLLSAKEPFTLLFTDLPRACRYEPFGGGDSTNKREVRKFVDTLREALDELRMAHPQLLNRMRDALSRAFDLSGDFQRVRNALSARADGILIAVKDSRLKAFCMRLADCNLPEAEWLESLGSLVASLPPSKWADLNEEVFDQELDQLVGRFKRVESMAFTARKKKAGGESAVRVTITQPDGSEVDDVIYVSKDEEERVAELEARIASLLKEQKRIGMAATARVFWKALSRN